MPDIDMDFDERYAGEMIRYASERWGSDHVAQIVTFSTIKARAAVPRRRRVLGYPYGVGDRIAKAMPPLVMAGTHLFGACFQEDPKACRRLQDGKRTARDVAGRPRRQARCRRCQRPEGLRRQDGIHAAARRDLE